MSKDSFATTSRVWSCQTLNDGVNKLLNEADEIDAEEAELEKQIEDSKPI